MGSNSLFQGLNPSLLLGFPGSSESKESACNAGDLGLIPGSGRSPGEGNSNPFQHSCLENPMERPWGCNESDMTEGLTVSISKSNGKSLYGFNQRRLTILKHLPGYSGEKVINRLNMLLQNT